MDEAIPKFNAGQRVVFDAVVGCVLPGVSSSNLEAPVSNHSAQQNAGSRVFFSRSSWWYTKDIRNASHPGLPLPSREESGCSCNTCSCRSSSRRGAHRASNVQDTDTHTAESTCSIFARSQLAQDLLDTDFIISDDIVMCHRYCVEAVDRSFRDITRRNLPFGGKCVLFSGDFRQILPVILGASRAQIVHACVKYSALYAGFRILHLTENMRLSSLRNDPNATETALQFPNYLLGLGEGRLESAEDGTVELPESVQKVLDIDTLCSTVFDGLESNYSDVS